MGKAERNRLQNARQKIAEQQAAAKRAEARRRAFIAGGSVLAVIVVVAVLLVIKLNNKSATQAGGTTAATAASVAQSIASVPASTLDKVAAGPAYPAPNAVYPHAIQTVNPPGALLTSGGKPEVVYVGAEYCPYCAAERWALTLALSRFGTFSGLNLIHSSSTDVYPNTPTLTYLKASYTSKYLVFSSTEAQTVTHAPLQPLTALDKTLMAKYDAPPYVPSGYNGSFPFVDFGNRYVIDGASYDPGLLAKLSWQQIATDLADPSSKVGIAVDAAANHITAALCKLTNNQPGNVCTSAGVSAASGSI